MTPASPMLALAVEAARAAGAVVHGAASRRAGLQVQAKRPNDFVTEVDLASEAAIVRTLRTAQPGHAVRSEESATHHGPAGARQVWIVDPLDGTTNFIHGYPAYAVSIALAVDGVLEVAAVLDVARDELFTAQRGAGAWCAGERIAVASRPALHEAVVASSCPLRRGPGHEADVARLARVMQAASALRRSGCAALDLAWTAAGRCDAQFDAGLAAWDVAAGALLVREAGGRATRFDGSDDLLEARECVAANPALHAALRALLQP